MPDGSRLFELWIGILCLGMKSGRPGILEIGDGIPFNDETLSIELDITLPVVRLGLETFIKFKMIEIFETGEIYLINYEKHQQLEKITHNKRLNRERVKKHRDKVRHVMITAPLPNGNVTPADLDSDLDKDLDKDIINKMGQIKDKHLPESELKEKVKSVAKKPIPHFRELTDHFQNLYIDKMEGVKPEWGAKQTELLKRDIKKVMGTGEEWCDVLKAAMELFIFDKIPDVESFTQKAGREYGIFHSSLGAILNAMLKEAKR